RRLAHADHRVERVAVLAARVRDEAVVGRIDDRAEQEAVELDRLQLLVPLVLVAAPLGDLDEAVNAIGHEAACYGAMSTTAATTDLQQLSIDTIRTLSMDA